LLDGEPVKRVREMMKAIYEQAGTVDWSEPDIWIDERLTGDLRTLAR
jgi:restriction system protein